MKYRATYLDYIFDDITVEGSTLEEIVTKLTRETETFGPISQLKIEKVEPISKAELEMVIAQLPQ